MSRASHEEDVALAIAMSLSEKHTHTHSVDEDFALALSLQDELSSNTNTNTNTNTRSSPSQSGSGSILRTTRAPSERTDQDLALALALQDQDGLSRPSPVPEAHLDEDFKLALALQDQINTSDPPPAVRPPSRGPRGSSGSNSIGGLGGLFSGLLGFVAPSCKGCGRAVAGAYISLPTGDAYHRACFVCEFCGENISQPTFQIHDGKLYHAQCHHELFDPRCVVCSQLIPVRGGRIEYKTHPFFRDERYCVHHTDLRTCTSCQRPEPLPTSTSGPFADLSDGRCVCMSCVRNVVLDSDEAAPIYAHVLRFLALPAPRGLGLEIPPAMRSIPVLAVDTQTLNERNTHAHSHTRGLCLSEVGHVPHFSKGSYMYDPRTNRFVQAAPVIATLQERRSVTAILVLHGLPRDLFASILAHESMHAWLRLNSRIPAHLEPQVEEGLCQYVAYRYLEHLEGSNESGDGSHGDISDNKLRQYFKFAIESDPGEVYGEGFRKAIACVNELGLDTVIDHVATHGSFPAV